MSFSIVGQKFTPETFAAYLKSRIARQAWVSRIVLHNTAAPSLAQRPGGVLTETHIRNLHRFYAEQRKWSGGPHLFVDAEGIWVFNPLDRPGVHSPSHNRSSWGIEMLGDFETESFETGLGAKVRYNSIAAAALLARTQEWPSVKDRLILHKEDPATTHDCPGKNVSKADFVAAVDSVLAPRRPDETVVLLDGRRIDGTITVGGAVYVPLRPFSEAAGMGVEYDRATNVARVTIRRRGPGA